MAAEGDGAGGGGDLPHSMVATDGHDLDAELWSQLSALRLRVEELEKENEKLRSQMSRCRCSKEEVPTFPVSSIRTYQRANQQDEIHLAEILDPISSDHPDYSVTSSHCLLKDRESRNGLHLEHIADCVQLESREEKGSHMRTIHHYAKRYVALKVMYFGQRFYGFAAEAQMDPTVESEIFKALERTKLLVGRKEDLHYSRCGRTDKGVSSTG